MRVAMFSLRLTMMRVMSANVWLCLRRAASVLCAEEVVRTDERDGFEKICDGREARVATAFIIELAVTQELELRPVEGVAVNLPVVQLD